MSKKVWPIICPEPFKGIRLVVGGGRDWIHPTLSARNNDKPSLCSLLTHFCNTILCVHKYSYWCFTDTLRDPGNNSNISLHSRSSQQLPSLRDVSHSGSAWRTPPPPSLPWWSQPPPSRFLTVKLPGWVSLYSLTLNIVIYSVKLHWYAESQLYYKVIVECLQLHCCYCISPSK